MTLTEEQKHEVVKLRLDNAAGALSDAELLLKSGSLRGAANRAYYAMFHAASALAVLDGHSFKKHAGLIRFFQKHYAKPELLDRKHGRALQKAFDDRSEADYEDRIDFTVEEMTQRVKEAREFVSAVRDFITSSRRQIRIADRRHSHPT